MKLIEDLQGNKPLYTIITGNGTGDFETIAEFCRKFDGHNKYLWFPTSLPRKTGLSALNSIKLYASKYALKSIIFLVDGEHVTEDSLEQIRSYLSNIGINLVSHDSINDALLLKLKSGHHNILLYCIIFGRPQSCIEYEIAELIRLELNQTINL